MYVTDDHGEAWGIRLNDNREWTLSQIPPNQLPSAAAPGCTDLSIGSSGIAGEPPLSPRGRTLDSFVASPSHRGPAGPLKLQDGSSMTIELIRKRICLTWDWGPQPPA